VVGLLQHDSTSSSPQACGSPRSIGLSPLGKPAACFTCLLAVVGVVGLVIRMKPKSRVCIVNAVVIKRKPINLHNNVEHSH
jgi:hypothetical protein